MIWCSSGAETPPTCTSAIGEAWAGFYGCAPSFRYQEGIQAGLLEALKPKPHPPPRHNNLNHVNSSRHVPVQLLTTTHNLAFAPVVRFGRRLSDHVSGAPTKCSKSNSCLRAKTFKQELWIVIERLSAFSPPLVGIQGLGKFPDKPLAILCSVP